MYQTFKDKELLDGTERIEHLTLVAGFVSRVFVTLVVCVAIFTDIFLYGLIVPVLPFALKVRMGLPEDDIQLWASAFLAIYGGSIFLGSLLFGWIGDHTKTRKGPFLLGLIVVGGATLLTALTTSLPLLLLARVLQGLSTSSVFTIGYCLLLDTVGSEHIGSALGFTSMSLSLGLFAGPIIGGFIYDIAGYVAVFSPAFALIIIEIILCGLLQPLPPGYKQHPSFEHHPSCEESPLLHHLPEGQEQSSPPALVILLRSPRFLIAMIGMCMLNTFVTALEAVLPIFLQDLFHYTSSQIAIVFLSNSLPLMILSPLAGYCVDRIGPVWPAILGFVLTAPSLMLLGLIQQNTILSSVLLRFMATEAVEKHHPGVFSARGTYSQAYGLSNAAFAAGTLAGPLYPGYIWEWAGWGPMTVSMGVLSLVAVGLVVVFTGRQGGWSSCRREDV
ncbi:major facilitator superfamily domain-containing protein [Aspergillus parasiticus]|uniref:Major facilitator superfamily domain-containing protein n=1 Tax=Aspergillus parasiticus TaxID=5067 RepID=A0A5N6DB86_ASPPA|nr:major facilitator superfamily domain-containing protein [Aspergillus parasiticus]